MTARQAAARWGRKAIGPKVREALEDGRPDDAFEFLHVVMPRADRDPERRDNRNLPFASVWIEIASEHKIGESGFHELPYAVPRWDTASGELYGRSPGMIALPDAQSLNQMGKTLLRAGHKAVDPPLFVPDESVTGTLRTWPGGITYFDPDVLRATGGRDPVFPLQTGTNLPFGRDMQADGREQVWAAFFRNILNLPAGGPQMTATEVIERKDEFIRTVGPVFGRLEADYTSAVVERVFGVMFRAGAFPQPPEALRGRDVHFEYASPVERARKEIEAAAARRNVEVLAPYVQADPSLMDIFDGDKIVRAVSEANGLPQDWLRPREEVEAMRAQRVQAAQQAAQAFQAAQAAQQPAESNPAEDPSTRLAEIAGAGQAA